MKRKLLVVVLTAAAVLAGCSETQQNNSSAVTAGITESPGTEEVIGTPGTEGVTEESGNAGTEQTEEDENMNNTAELRFHSFDGGGPEFSVVISDPEIVSCVLSSDRKADPYSTATGSSYNVICTLTGLKPGETSVTVQERSPIADNLDHIYTVTVSSDLNVTVDERGAFEAEGVLAEMKMLINDREVPVKWLWNDSSLELSYMLPVTVKMSMYGGFEQVGVLSEYGSLPSSDERITTQSGDIVLYSGDQLVIFYGSNTWEYTRLGIIDLPENELRELLGNGDVTVNIGNLSNGFLEVP